MLRRISEEWLDLIRLHYPREGCEEPWTRKRIADAIGCTEPAVDYQACRLGIGKHGIDWYKQRHREQLNTYNRKLRRKRYRTDEDFRRNIQLQSKQYYWNNRTKILGHE